MTFSWIFELRPLAILTWNIGCFLLSYVVCFLTVLLIAGAVDTAGLMLARVFYGLERTVFLLILAISAVATYLGVAAYCCLVSCTALHVSSAMLALVVIVDYSSKSAQYRTAVALALLADDNVPAMRLNAAMARANAIGHVFGFAVAALVYLRASAAF